MKNKGFTLIELLAIIVILAIIAVIAVPQIANVIEDSKKNATKDSAYGYKNAVHQYYLTEYASNPDINMSGEYSIENGVLTDGVNMFNVSPSGSVPESGEVTIENGEIINGCIDYGNYSVVIENRNITETNSGNCYNISYITYDENATEGENGTITSKLSNPNPSWTYYVKEYESPNRYRVGIWNKVIEEFDDSTSFLSLDSCQSFLNENADEEEIEYFECRNKETYKTYQICGVSSGKTFCLKPGENNYNISVLDGVFDSCEVGSSGGTKSVVIESSLYTCDDDGISVSLYRNFITINHCDVGVMNNDEYEQYQAFQCLEAIGNIDR